MPATSSDAYRLFVGTPVNPNVTQDYYIAYQNYIKDTTNTVPMPAKPTINELSEAYGALNNYKMLSDSVVLNSVLFKPLFGAKSRSSIESNNKSDQENDVCDCSRGYPIEWKK